MLEPEPQQLVGFAGRHCLDRHDVGCRVLGQQGLLALARQGRDDELDVGGQVGWQPRQAARRARELVERVEDDDERPFGLGQLQALAELDGEVVVIRRDGRLIALVGTGDLAAQRIEKRAAVRRSRRRADEAVNDLGLRMGKRRLLDRLGHEG